MSITANNGYVLPTKNLNILANKMPKKPNLNKPSKLKKIKEKPVIIIAMV